MKITDSIDLIDEQGNAVPTVVTFVYDEEGYDDDFVSLFDVESNTNTDFGVYMFFHNDDFNRDYILFCDFASSVNMLALAIEDNRIRLVENDEEWDMIDEVLMAVEDQEENGYES